MTETHFTPGPLHIDDSNEPELEIINLASLTIAGTVDCTPYYGDLEAAAQQRAYADLFAAAPDLYAALEAILNKVDYENPGAAFEPDSGCLECTSGVTPNRFNTGPCAHHRAIAALKKARGES